MLLLLAQRARRRGGRADPFPEASRKRVLRQNHALRVSGAVQAIGQEDQYDLPKFGSRTKRGIFMGYHLHSGGRWSGDYLVMDEEAYRSRDADNLVPVRRYKEVWPEEPTRFLVPDDSGASGVTRPSSVRFRPGRPGPPAQRMLVRQNQRFGIFLLRSRTRRSWSTSGSTSPFASFVCIEFRGRGCSHRIDATILLLCPSSSWTLVA
jgi:hypothetical protein